MMGDEKGYAAQRIIQRVKEYIALMSQPGFSGDQLNDMMAGGIKQIGNRISMGGQRAIDMVMQNALGHPGGTGQGPGGICECPVCGMTTEHQIDFPCNTITCPSCGAVMDRPVRKISGQSAINITKKNALGHPGGTRQGPGGVCTCPACGVKTEHLTDAPCNTITCPSCGAAMTR